MFNGHSLVDGRVVDEDIYLPEGGNSLLNGSLPVLFGGHVQTSEQRSATGLVNLGLHLLALILQYIGDNYRRALLSEQPGLRRPLASGASGNQSHLVFKSHNTPSKGQQPSYLYPTEFNAPTR